MSRRRKAKSRNIMGGVLIGVVLAALGAFAVAGVLLRPPPTHAETLCRTDAPLTAHTIVLIDSTDRLEPRHRRKLEAVVAQERERLAQYQRLTLMRINARRPQEPAVLFSKCLPRPPGQANPLFENPRLAQERWDADFASAMESALRSAQRGGAGRASPLIAGVRAVAADPNFGSEIAQRRFVLVSDLLEHDPQGFSLYAEAVDYAAWRSDAAHTPAELTNIDVRLSPLDRPDFAARQQAAITRFWQPYFDEAETKSVSIDPY